VQGAVLAALLLLAPAPAAAADAAVAVEVPAGQTRSIRIRNIPVGTMLAVRVATSGRLLVALIGARQLREPNRDSKPLFRGSVQDKLAFRVTVPVEDDYVLVLSNRGGNEARSVEAEIRAVRPARKPAPRDYSPRPEKASWSPS
jgi:hypothetical protein